jgi:predicted enzyme related to lactoylglutathione lyase
MAGQLVHFELPSSDTARARSFWSGVFGWTFSDPGIPGLEYWMTRTGENQGGAVLPAEGDPGGVVVYFDSDDIKASVAKVREFGGSSEDPSPIPNVGWFARCADSEGNSFRLFQRDESASG